MSKVIFTCQECGNGFEVYKSRAKHNPKFCTTECKYKNVRERETPNRKKIECLNCNKQVVKYNCRIEATSTQFCGMKCHDEYRSKQIEIPCEECEKPFKVKIARIEKQNPRYCSMKCRNKAFRGENSPLYTMQKRNCLYCKDVFVVKQNQIDVGRGLYCSNECKHKSFELDRPEDSKHFYGTSFWLRLRSDCYNRDNHTCQRCEKTKVRLDAHHIVPRTFGGEDKLENLISLCSSCHHIVEHEVRKQHKL